MNTHTSTGKILHGIGQFGERLERVSADEVRWDGSATSTTHQVRLTGVSAAMGRDICAHVEVVVTGRAARRQRVQPGRGSSYGVFGIKCRFRFTGADDTRTWYDGVLVG